MLLSITSCTLNCLLNEYSDAHRVRERNYLSIACPWIARRSGIELRCRIEQAGANESMTVRTSVRLCSRAESHGGAETLITHPSSTTHADLDSGLRLGLGIAHGLLRLSVGLEVPKDIVADLEQAIQWAIATELRHPRASRQRQQSSTVVGQAGLVTAAETSRMCAGRVRQHPPTICAPAANHCAACAPYPAASPDPVQQRFAASQPSPELG